MEYEMFENVFKFLELQMQEMLHLDEVEGYTERQRQRGDFAVQDPVSGRSIGLREMLYANSLSWIKNESQKVLYQDMQRLSAPGVLNEATLSTGIATFPTSILPAVRRIYSNLIAMDLVSVQPLTTPTGYIYWLDHVYTDTKADESIVGGTTRLDQVRPKQYALSGEATTIRGIQYKLTKKLIETLNYKLKADWTIEAEQDLKSQWKMDLESEIIPQVTEEVIRETDKVIIDQLLAGAGAGNVNWNTNYPTADATTTDRKSYDATLYGAVLDANQLIIEKKFINASWLITTPAVYTRLSKLENFNIDPLAIGQIGNIGRRYVGTIGNIFKVYVDPWFTANKILLGVKGDSWKYAVGYYSPYIPLFVSEKYIRNDDFTQFARGAMSRFASGVLPELSTGTATNNGLATVTLVST